MKRPLKFAARPATLVVGAGLLASAWLSPAPVRAADKYDTDLERRVQTLERELNIMEGDKKGKNAEEAEVPTFLRAAKNVKELVITGELRLRNEYSQVDSQLDNTTSQADRNRFRFRLFADYKLDNNFYAGAAIQTSQTADSGNTTFTEGFDNYQVYLWRFFVGYKTDAFTIVAGKHANPFYSNTELLIDADISPTGISETYKLPISTQFELQLIAGQYIFYDNAENALYNNPRTIAGTGAAAGTQVANPNFVENGTNDRDTYLLYQQIVATFKATNDLVFTGAGGFLFYPTHGGTNSATALNPGQNVVGPAGGVLANGAAFNSANSTRDLDIATGSADVKIGLGALKLKVYGDVAYNFKGGSRIATEYGNTRDDDETDKFAFATGVTIGSDYQIKKKGDYLLLAEYRQVGLGSIDPNLNDSDFNFSRLGFRGIKGAVSYAFQGWLIGSVTYYGSNNLGRDQDLNIGLGALNAAHTVQFDLTTRF